MSSFYNSFKDAVGNFGLQIIDSIQHPIGIYTHFSRRSIPLSGTFLVSNFIGYVFEKIKTEYTYDEKKYLKKIKKKQKEEGRGHQIIQFFYIMIVWSWDTIHKCYHNHVIPDFFTVVQQGIIVIATLFCVMFAISCIPFYTTVTEAMPFFVTNILEGGIAFTFYNFIVNFRDRYKYNSCTQLNILELEQNALLDTKDKVGWTYNSKPSTVYVNTKAYINDTEIDSGSSVYKSKDLNYVRLT